MFDVFVSYSHADGAVTEKLVAALTAEGLNVDWDSHFQIACGVTLTSLLAERCDTAICVLVLWSRHSVASSWVLQEATRGLHRRRLLQATLDGTEPPLGFRDYIYGDLSAWDGTAQDRAFRKVADGVCFFRSRPRS